MLAHAPRRTPAVPPSARSLASWLLFVAILCGFLYTTFAKFLVGFLGPEVVRKPSLGVAYVTPAHVTPYIAPAVELANRAIDDVKRACWCVSYAHTAKYLACSWLLSQVSRRLSLGALSYLAFLGSSVGFKVYAMHRAEIDEAVAQATAQLDELKGRARELAAERVSEVRAKLDNAKSELLGLWENAAGLLSGATSSLGGAVKAAQAALPKAGAGAQAAEAEAGADEEEEPEVEDDEDEED